MQGVNLGTQINLPLLVNATGVAACMLPCIDGMVTAANQALTFQQTIESIFALCSQYDNARVCVESKSRTCLHQKSFMIGTSGMKVLCVDRKTVLLPKQKCLDTYLDQTLQDCDAKFGLRTALVNLSQNPDVKKMAAEGGQPLRLLKMLNETCTAIGPFVACMVPPLNDKCQGAGTQIADGIITPFRIGAQTLISGGRGLVAFARRQMPASCHYLIDPAVLNQIRLGTPPPPPPATRDDDVDRLVWHTA